jgi:hypothetical protein
MEETLKRKIRAIGNIDIKVMSGETWLEGEFEIPDDKKYVQVEFIDSYLSGVVNQLYTYVDPFVSGLSVGELVDVPTVYRKNNKAIVRKLGDGYNGKASREVNFVYGPPSSSLRAKKGNLYT